MACLGNLCIDQHHLRLHAHVPAPTKLPSPGIPTLLRANHLHDSNILCRLMVSYPWMCTYPRLGYRFYRSATYYEFGMNIYESIVICSFFILLCNFLGTELHNTVRSKERQRLVFPLCCIRVRPSNWVCPLLRRLTIVVPRER
jgi:Organic solute transporter Ostalpha